ncbi:ArsR family transcriptional regulator [Chromatiales bacterium (ex Bugula neritina AB1)]|nr:ArsR family transcriptional regulator [Chromatiales bacterium (ex Bugula neritina AB1)]
MSKLDELDRKILREIQQDSNVSMDALAKKIGSSKTPVWSRIQKLRKNGVIDKQVALLNPAALGLAETFFMAVKTDEHDQEWLKKFAAAVQDLPEILEAHRMTGDIDYLLKVRVASTTDFDRVYKELISRVKLHNVTSSLSMECLKHTTALKL